MTKMETMEHKVEDLPVDQDNMDTTEEHELTPEEKALKEKQEWVKQFRLKFCVREEFEITKNMIYPDGTLNQE